MRYKILVLMVFCAAIVTGIAGPGTNVEARAGSLDAEFETAATEYGVPKELLLAMGYVNTRWEMPPPHTSGYEEKEAGEKSPEARGSYGIMQLVQNPSRDTLGEAAGLTGVSEEQLKTGRAENIRGGAAVLAGLQGTDQPEDLGGWYETVAGYGGGPAYAEQVYEALEKGASEKISSGEQVRLAARGVVAPRRAEAARAVQSAGEYPGSTWYGTSGNNYTAASRPSSNPINKIVIHVMQGSWSSAINWFKDPAAGASAHYSVRSSDGFIGQSVAEKDIGYHAGNWPYNQTSIGIEHEGYVSDPKWFTEAMYDSSARLSAYLCNKYLIPIDRDHIVGHVEVPYPSDHYDPGYNWNWYKYMDYVLYYATTV